MKRIGKHDGPRRKNEDPTVKLGGTPNRKDSQEPNTAEMVVAASSTEILEAPEQGLKLVEDGTDILAIQRTKRSTTTLGLVCAMPGIIAALFMTLWRQPQIVAQDTVSVYRRFEAGSLMGVGLWLLIWAAAVWLIIRLARRITEDPLALSGYFLLCIGTPALFALGISTAVSVAIQKVLFADDTTSLLPEGLSILISAGLLVSIGGLVLLLASRFIRMNPQEV